MRACILVRTETGKHHSVADQILAAGKGVEDAIAVFGPADVVVRANVADHRALDALVTTIETTVEGVERTETLPELALPERGVA